MSINKLISSKYKREQVFKKKLKYEVSCEIGSHPISRVFRIMKI